MKKLILFPILLFAITSHAQTKLTIQSNETFGVVQSNFRNSVVPFGRFEGERLNTGEGIFTVRSFLHFDLSSIPKGSFVNWARLTLFGFDEYGPNMSLLRRVISAWDPGTITWNMQPITVKRGTIRLPQSTTNNEDYKNINVTNLLQIMVDSPSSSFGFALRLDSDEQGSAERAMIFWPPNSSFPPKTPRLVIEYTSPGFQPAITSMSVDLQGPSGQMSIYPNPCNGTFNCTIKSATDRMILRVIDLLGRMIYVQHVDASNLQLRVNLPSNSAGTYYVVLQNNKNETIVSQEVEVN